METAQTNELTMSVNSAPAVSEAAPAVAPVPEARPSRQPSMAEVMESDAYMTGVDPLKPGSLIEGVVVRIDENSGETMVDIGAKSEGIIPKDEVGREEFVVGDTIEVVVRHAENDDGHPVLSKARADYKRMWRELSQAKTDQIAVEGTVKELVKGGLIIDLGVQAFIPARYVDTRHKTDLGRFIGRTIPVKIVEIDEKRSKVIASHVAASEEARKAREEEAWNNVEKDKIVEGTVQRITEFGAFVDIGGIDGLLHVREMSWGRVEHPSLVVKKGQRLQVVVLDIDEERHRIALGLKQLQPDPWKNAAKNFRVGQIVTGKVTRLAPTCAFVEVEAGIEAIIPIAEMSEQRIKSPEDVLTVGQQVEARIKTMEPRQRRISLSLKAAVQEKERRETRTAMREVNERGGGDEVRLGDVFGQALRAAKERGKERERAVTTTTRKEAHERAIRAAQEEEDEFEPIVEEEWTEEEVADEVADESVAAEVVAEEVVAEVVTEEVVEVPAEVEPEKEINFDSLPGALHEDTEAGSQPDSTDSGAPVADEIAASESGAGKSSPVE